MLQYAELSNRAMRRLAVLHITLAGNRRYNDGVGIPVPRIILQDQNRPVTSLFRSDNRVQIRIIHLPPVISSHIYLLPAAAAAYVKTGSTCCRSCYSSNQPICPRHPGRQEIIKRPMAVGSTGIAPLRGSLRAAPTCYDGSRQKPLQRSTLWPDRSIAPTDGHGHTRSRRVMIAAVSRSPPLEAKRRQEINTRFGLAASSGRSWRSC